MCGGVESFINLCEVNRSRPTDWEIVREKTEESRVSVVVQFDDNNGNGWYTINAPAATARASKKVQAKARWLGWCSREVVQVICEGWYEE